MKPAARILLFCFSLILPVAASAGSVLSSADAIRALAILEQCEHRAVRALKPQERSLLMATSALIAGKPKQTIAVLETSEGLKDDPLAALLQAEAYRRLALRSLTRARDFDHILTDKKRILKNADLAGELTEAVVRLKIFLQRLDGPQGKPSDLLMLGSQVKSVFLVDKARSRLFVYTRNDSGRWLHVADEFVVTGTNLGDKRVVGDKRTPNGVYRFIDKHNGEKLLPKYGPIAFSIDYPNALDRLNRKTGSGIWLHGFDAGITHRPAHDSRGCFVLPNSRLLALARHIQVGNTWVVVGEHLQFAGQDEHNQLLEGVLQTIEAWRRDWQSGNVQRYLSHYHPSFRGGRRNLSAWSRHKQRTIAGKRFIRVELKDFTVVRHPNPVGFAHIIVAEFEQDYRSDNYNHIMRKRLYLTRDGDHQPWRILIEEAAKL